MLLDDIADYLSTSGLGTVGTNIFKGGFPPDAPDASVCVYETGGFGTVHAMHSQPGNAVVERPRIQVVARAAEYDYATARSTSQAAFLLLDGLRNRTINGKRYLWITSLHSPFSIGADDNRRVRIGMNYDVMKDL